MEKIDRNLAGIGKRIRESGGCVLMLDFDGTLSPIAETPEKAVLPRSTKKVLGDLAKRCRVVIISGRSLGSIKEKVGIPGLVYAGGHGMEWEIGGKVGRFKVPGESLDGIRSVKKELARLLPEFKGMLLEDKKGSLAIHYRLVGPIDLGDFKRKVLGVLNPLIGKGLEVVRGKKVFELRPDVDWDKGYFAEFIVGRLERDSKRRLLPIYIGDDTTDEDVFAKMPDAVTIRVGKKSGSVAKYYLESQGGVDGFLEWVSGQVGNAEKPL